MMNLAIFGQLIILIVLFQFFSLSGIEGKMFKPMAMTLAALVGAMILFYLCSSCFHVIFETKRGESKLVFQ
jgi:cobalt-zinc-cadmium resistance protein CzcA